MRSDPLTKGINAAPQRSLLKALGLCDAEIGKPLPQITLNWSTQKEFVSTALCGVRNPKEAAENCETFTWQLSDAHMAAIDKAIAENLDFDGSAPVK